MKMNRIDTIISESIEMALNEDFFDEKKKKHHDKDISDLIGKYFRNHKKKNKKKMKVRKKSGGREEYYDYDSYKDSNKEVSQGDASSVRDEIDTEKTNIASVARDLFPDHTEEGAQSQLRKILNGERPMTNKVAIKLDKLLSMGKVAKK